MASSKLLAAKRDEGDTLNIDMSPMIDMVFLLLIFFLVNATMIIVKMDPEVEPPVAKNSVKAEEGKGRIVINIREDGDLYSEKGEALDEVSLIELVSSEKERFEAIGQDPKIHLRGDKRAVFEHCQKVLRWSSKAGVDKIVFAVLNFEG